MWQRRIRVTHRVGWLGGIFLRGPVYAIQFFGFAIVGFEIIVGNRPGRRFTCFVTDCSEVTLPHPVHRCAVEFCWTAHYLPHPVHRCAVEFCWNAHYAGPRRCAPDVYAYRIPGPPRRQAEEITTLQDEYAEVALRETIGQRGAAESGADHYRIITLRSRRNHR